MSSSLSKSTSQRWGVPPASSSCFGPHVGEVKVSPRRGENGPDVKVQKPHTGMTIRLTPELLARLQKTGPRPVIELVLKSAAEGGPVLIVGGEKHYTNAHQMAVGSEVHLVARTEAGATGVLAKRQRQRQQQRSEEEEMGAETSRGLPSMSVFASLHRKLIVQQVLTNAKRAEIRARTEGSARLIEESRKTNIMLIQDQDEMLAAAEAIPMPARKSPAADIAVGSASGGGSGAGGNAVTVSALGRRRWLMAGRWLQRETEGERESGRGFGFGGRRDPMTAWFYDCYCDDEYTGHVADLRKFLCGIDFHHVMFRYHVDKSGELVPDRRRFCIKFKTKGGRDLAVGRSGEAFGGNESWKPDSVPVVKGRDESDMDKETLSDFLLMLPSGSSVAEVLEKVKDRLPQDLTPAVMQGSPFTPSEANNRYDRGGGRYDDQNASFSSSTKQKENLERYRRDMVRAALGATLAEAEALGPEWGSPCARMVGTDEGNARRVATVAASEAARELGAGVVNTGVGGGGAWEAREGLLGVGARGRGEGSEAGGDKARGMTAPTYEYGTRDGNIVG